MLALLAVLLARRPERPHVLFRAPLSGSLPSASLCYFCPFPELCCFCPTRLCIIEVVVVFGGRGRRTMYISHCIALMRQSACSAEASAHPLLYLHQPPCCAGGRQEAERAERQRQHARADAEQDAGHERRDDPREPRKGGGDPGRSSAVPGGREGQLNLGRIIGGKDYKLTAS